MSDLFEELEGELRSEQRSDLLRSLIPWVTAIFALVILGELGYWGFSAWQDRNLAQASDAYQKGVDNLGTNDAVAAAEFIIAAKAGSPGYKTLALMQQGNAQMTAGKPDAAAALYDQAAAAAPNQVIGDLARLKAALALIDTAPLPQLQTRLQPLADAKRPYAVYAKEALAMAELMAGKTADARRDFNAINLNLDATDDMRQRSQLAVALIDQGDVANAVAAVKLAATLPPPPPPSLQPPPGAQDQGGPPAPPSAGAAQ